MNKTGCLICGKDLIYFDDYFNVVCYYCKKDFSTNIVCVNNHFVCDKCHSSDAINIIETYCINSQSQNAVEMAVDLMKHNSLKMHGPEHHFLVPAVLLTAFYNFKNQHEEIAEKLQKARQRAEKIPGGFCGTHGNCGAGVGTGIFISLITDANPLSGIEWQQSNLITAKSLYEIALSGGPRCCKRDTYIALNVAIDYLNKEFGTSLENKSVKCNFSRLNQQCNKEKCKFFIT